MGEGVWGGGGGGLVSRYVELFCSVLKLIHFEWTGGVGSMGVENNHPSRSYKKREETKVVFP